MDDESFQPTHLDLLAGIQPLVENSTKSTDELCFENLPEFGIGERRTITTLAPIVFNGAAHLGAAHAFAHMDPPTPWITWITTLWNASLNQNLLHPDVSPKATMFEDQVIKWLAPFYNMSGGHMTPGSTISNLTALWVARDTAHIDRIITSIDSHLSIQKAANILGLKLLKLNTNLKGEININEIPEDLSTSALVLTAGTTASGAIDDLRVEKEAAWLHVDAAWAGPLRLSDNFTNLLDGIENADSVSISGHKWFFQPKESGLILFKDVSKANQTISASSGYLTTNNVGILGSHGAIALPLMATLIAWGKTGLIERLDRSMNVSLQLWEKLNERSELIVFNKPTTGVILWRLNTHNRTKELFSLLPAGTASFIEYKNQFWIRNVAANPSVDVEVLWKIIDRALDRLKK